MQNKLSMYKLPPMSIGRLETSICIEIYICGQYCVGRKDIKIFVNYDFFRKEATLAGMPILLSNI